MSLPILHFGRIPWPTDWTEVFGREASLLVELGFGGGDNLVANNIIVNAGQFMIEFAHLGPTHPSYKHAYAGNRVERNILVCAEEDKYPYRFTRSPSPEDFPSFRKNLVWAGERDLVVLVSRWSGVKGWGAWLERGHETASIVAEPLVVHGIGTKAERMDRVKELLRVVGLNPEHTNRYPHEFSGGQRQRIGVARALALNPSFMVLDEPVSALDVSIQAQVINLLDELQEEFDLTYLFIAHDLSVVHYVSDRVAIMYLGKIVEEGPTDEIFANPAHPYTQALMAAVPVVDKAARRERIILEGTVPSPIDPPSGCRFHTRCFAKIGAICEEDEPRFTSVGKGHRAACHLFSVHD